MGRTNQEQLNKLHELIRVCTACPLHRNRSHAVPGEGSPGARLMLIGEAPGAREDELGRPFCGRAGDFLDKLFSETGWARNEVYITSTVKCRPPENRNPEEEEMKTCGRLWLGKQIELVNPEIVILLGKIPISLILKEKGTLRDLHGRVRELKGRRFVPTYHPAAAMRFPEPAKGIREDFRLVKNMLQPSRQVR